MYFNAEVHGAAAGIKPAQKHCSFQVMVVTSVKSKTPDIPVLVLWLRFSSELTEK